jgi:ABC-type multidrug transport system ATPase subunit
LSEIEELCDRVAILSKGEIKATDTPENLRMTQAQRQKVTVTVSNLEEGAVRQAAEELLPGCLVECVTDVVTLTFERRPDDDLLGTIIARLSSAGGIIADVKIEMPTLLDVMESYE